MPNDKLKEMAERCADEYIGASPDNDSMESLIAEKSRKELTKIILTALQGTVVDVPHALRVKLESCESALVEAKQQLSEAQADAHRLCILLDADSCLAIIICPIINGTASFVLSRETFDAAIKQEQGKEKK